MNTTIDLSKAAVPQAQPAAVARPKVARLTYLDTLRVILISLVIALHTSIAYGAMGDWTYVDPASNEISGIVLTIVTTLVQAFSLGLYFFVSGYFTPGSYDRKGILRFWKDRLLRLAIPLIVYTWLLNRIPNYFAALAKSPEPPPPFLVYTWQTFLKDADEGPTWFIFALLIFCIGYTLWRLATRRVPAEKLAWISRLKVPGTWKILGFGLVVGTLMFLTGLKFSMNETWNVFGIFNLMIIFFPQYILFFIAGVVAYRNDWLARLNGKSLRFWAWLSLGLILALPVAMVAGGAASGSTDAFTGGLHWQSVVFILVWIGLSGVAFSMTLLLWLRDRKQPQGRIMALAGPNSYGVYLIHPLILVPLSVGFSYLALPPLVKFVIVLPLTIVLCFLIADGLRRIPGMKTIL